MEMMGKMEHKGYEFPFSMIHKMPAGDQVNLMIGLAVDPALEGLAAAFYMDGSDSMRQSGNYGPRGVSRLAARLGREWRRNPVSEAMRVIVPYIAAKDASKTCLVAYWGRGDVQYLAPSKRWRETIQEIGELTAEDAAERDYRGPDEFGNATHLLPPTRHFVEYIRGLQKGGEEVQVALAVIVTDGKFHDLDRVLNYSLEELGPRIMKDEFPRANLSIVGVGPEIDEEQMGKLMHMGSPKGYPGFGIWSYAIAEQIDDLAEVVSHLVDKNTPAFWGGATIEDDKGTTIASFEDMVPAVIELEVPATTKSFTLHVGDKSFTENLADIPVAHMPGIEGMGEKGMKM